MLGMQKKAQATHPISSAKAKAMILQAMGLGLMLVTLPASAEGTNLAHAADRYAGAPSLNQIDSDEQLSILKQSVLDYALERNARVAATSWTDDVGALNEDVLLLSNLQLEKLRPQPYINRFGLKGTRLVESDTAAASNANLEQSCSRPGVRRQRLKVTMQPVNSTGPSIANLAADSARLIREEIIQATRFGALQDTTLIESAPLGTSAGTDYLQYMVLGEQVTPDLEVTIRISGRSESKVLDRFWVTKSSRGPIRLDVEVIAQSTLGVQFSRSGSMLVRSGAADKRAQKAWLELPKSAVAELTEWSSQAIVALGASIRCDTGAAIVLVHRPDGGLLMAGEDVGLFEGQKFLIMPSSALAQRQGLERALGAIGLAQITALNKHTASIDLYAGPKPRTYDNMIAIPLAALAP